MWPWGVPSLLWAWFPNCITGHWKLDLRACRASTLSHLMTGHRRPRLQVGAEDLGSMGTFHLPSSSRCCRLPLGELGPGCIHPWESSGPSLHPSVSEDLTVIYGLIENPNLLVNRARMFIQRKRGGFSGNKVCRRNLPQKPRGNAQDGFPSSQTPTGPAVTLCSSPGTPGSPGSINLIYSEI